MRLAADSTKELHMTSTVRNHSPGTIKEIIRGDAVAEVDVETPAGTSLSDWEMSSAQLLSGATYPVLFLDYPSFVYPFGLEYTATNLLGPDDQASPPFDWGREDDLGECQDRCRLSCRAQAELAWSRA